jgi:hypothetical protein
LRGTAKHLSIGGIDGDNLVATYFDDGDSDGGAFKNSAKTLLAGCKIESLG